METTGRVHGRTPRGTGARLTIETALGPLALGDSVAVNGACLTVVAADGRTFEADVSSETLQRTTLGDLSPGSGVNLERALAVGGRLGGHLVSGHVDGVARVTGVARDGEMRRVTLEAPADLSRYVAAKGSVALDGVSLTVNGAAGHQFDVLLIPHTSSVTTLSDLTPGRRLNLEVDLVARYVVRYLEASAGEGPSTLEAALRRSGFLG